MMRIFIEDNELDVYNDFTQQVTYAVDDLLNLDSKATSFTKTILIPSSINNNLLLGNIFEFGNSNFTDDGPNVFYNFNASKSAKARIEVNGLQVMKGILRLLRIIHDKGSVDYEIALFGELGGLISAIGNKKLEDIDFTKYNHNWNITNILDSWNPQTIFDHAGSYSFSSLTRSLILTNANFSKLKPDDAVSITGTSNNNQEKTIQSISIYPISSTTTLTSIVFKESVTNESGTGITLTKLNTGLGIGYTYPLINYGGVSYNIPSSSLSPTFLKYRDWQYKAFRPAVYVREYIDRIITGAGYRWESSFFNTNFFKRLIIPNNDRDLQRIGEDYLINAYGSGQVTYTYTYPAQLNHYYSNSLPIKFQNNIALIDFTYNSSTGEYTYNGGSARNINMTLLYNGYIQLYGKEHKLRLYVNNVIISEYVFPPPERLYLRYNFINIKFSHEVNINPNDVIKLDFYFKDIDSSRTKTYEIKYESAELSVEPSPKAFVDYSYDALINFNNAIPRNVQQRDFFTSIIKMFNLMITEDRYNEKTLKIEPDITFYLTDRSTYLDWSAKVDRSQPIIITPMSEANARYYQFKYKDDNDYNNEAYKKKFNETYGNRIYDNELEFAKNTQSIEVIFSPSVLEGANNEDKVWSSIYKNNNGLEEKTAHNIRLMQCKLIKGVEPYKILNGETNLVDSSGITSYMYAGHFNDPDYPTSDLNWGATKELYFTLVQGSLQNNIFNGFYSPYMAEITDKDSRLVQCTMKLTDVDIFNIDWRRYVYVDGILYRLKKIIDWSDDNTCKVELLRVINTTYLNEAITFDTTGINEQIWAADNLNTLYYNNGDAIPVAYSAGEWVDYGDNGIGCCAFFKYSGPEEQYGIDSGLGAYYNRFALSDSRGLAPLGWRLPTKADFEALDVNTDGNALKQAGVITWGTGNTGTNSTGFNALGLGYISGADGVLTDSGESAIYWSDTNYDSDETYYMLLGKTTSLIKTSEYGRNYNGYNVRLIKI